MTIAALAAYREALGERFTPALGRSDRAGAMLDRRAIERLLAALEDLRQEERRETRDASPAASAASGARALPIGAGFGADFGRCVEDYRRAASIGFDPETRRLRERFGEDLMRSAKVALLLGETAAIVDPTPLVASAVERLPDVSDALRAEVVGRAIGAIAELAPAIEAGAAVLVDPSLEIGPDDAGADPRAVARIVAAWEAASNALSGVAAEEAAPARAARALEQYERGRRGGAWFAPMFAAPAQRATREAAPSVADIGFAEIWAEMAVLAARYDLSQAATGMRREHLAEWRWGGWEADPKELPGLDGSEEPVAWRAPLGFAPRVEALPLADAVAMRLGEEMFEMRRQLIARAVDEARQWTGEGAPAGPSAETRAALDEWRRSAPETLARGRLGAAFVDAPEAVLTLACPPAPVAPVRDGLARLADAWPESRLIADLAVDAAPEPPSVLIGSSLSIRA